MVLAGKLITELGIKTPAERFYKLFASELHEVQVHCERIHHTKLHEGEDWHDTDTVKHWTYVIDGDKISKCTRDIDAHLIKGEKVAL
ncbi:uncharacterized protein LOC131639829 [Vicia villosa]|uniref:uncharacterized protein LOC131639829 n=1 Tax=Vicia villosa TaxID=3911 RepID=UPI00273AAAF3|nr:uncharacterized protein LOC131639829 [Vicia villosa]